VAEHEDVAGEKEAAGLDLLQIEHCKFQIANWRGGRGCGNEREGCVLAEEGICRG
jgi:hypothetical protein